MNMGDPGLIPGLGKSHGEGNSYPLQYCGLENSMDRGAWQATVQGVTNSHIQLSIRRHAGSFYHVALSSLRYCYYHMIQDNPSPQTLLKAARQEKVSHGTTLPPFKASLKVAYITSKGAQQMSSLLCSHTPCYKTGVLSLQKRGSWISGSKKQSQ